MSILSQLLRRQITFGVAAKQFEDWGAQTVKTLASEPLVVQTAGAVVSDLKQAASNAVAIADSLAGPIIAGSASAVEATADTAFKAYFGPFAPIASLATHDSVDRIAASLKALIDARAAEFKANMQVASAPVPAAAPPPAQPAS